GKARERVGTRRGGVSVQSVKAHRENDDGSVD
ncbi:MAG: hypothetical protein ACI80K_004788, partial [Paracoccaceae bacterium]